MTTNEFEQKLLSVAPYSIPGDGDSCVIAHAREMDGVDDPMVACEGTGLPVAYVAGVMDGFDDRKDYEEEVELWARTGCREAYERGRRVGATCRWIALN